MQPVRRRPGLGGARTSPFCSIPKRMPTMIDLYTANSSNGQRAAVILEECGLPYRVHKLDLMAGDQRKPEFLSINPAGAIPVIVDSDGPGGKPLTLSQSAAIVLYIAEKTRKFIPADP